MTAQQKIIKNKSGLLELANMFGNVSQACKVMGYTTVTVSIASKSSMIKAKRWLCKRFLAKSLY